MSGLSYVGKDAAAPTEITNRRTTNAIITTTAPNQLSVQTQVNGLITPSVGATWATRSYVNTQDAQFALPGPPTVVVADRAAMLARTGVTATVGAVSRITSGPDQGDWVLWATPASVFTNWKNIGLGNANYMTVQDALSVATSQVGQPTGVAALDAGGHVPLPNMPVLGAGYIQGPYGTTNIIAATTSATPVRIADFNIGTIALSFQPLVFMQVFVTGLMAHPVIEVRVANSATAVSYASSTLVARGQGRSLYNDFAAVTVLPCPSTTGQTPTNLGPNYQVFLSAWMYDLNGQSVQITSGSNVAVAAAFLLRGAQ